MGGRGTFAAGKTVKYTYETVSKIEGVKVLEPINKKDSRKLPEESHSSNSYIVLTPEGVFRQYREYNANHEVVLEIGYHHEAGLGHGDVLHIHIYKEAGVEHHGTAEKRKLTRAEYNKYKKYFKGVVTDEGKYFK